MVAGRVGDVDWSTGDCARRGVETRPGVGGLEHVPVGQDVEVLCQEAVVCVAEDMPGVGSVYFGEEIVAGRWWSAVARDNVLGFLEGAAYLLRTSRRGLLRGS